jgi:hypothetical protein
VLEHAQKHYEETWIHRPRRSLAGNTPVDAAAIRAAQSISAASFSSCRIVPRGGMISNYDFDRLRRKLGLLARQRDAGGSRREAGGVRYSARSTSPRWATAELAGLNAASLSDEQLEHGLSSGGQARCRGAGAHFADSWSHGRSQPQNMRSLPVVFAI